MHMGLHAPQQPTLVQETRHSFKQYCIRNPRSTDKEVDSHRFIVAKGCRRAKKILAVSKECRR